MNDIFSNAFQTLADSLFRCAAVPVVYQRRDGTSLSLTAVRGHSTVKVPDSAGVLIGYASKDYIFRIADLDFTPQRGDTVTDGTETYEVTALAGTSHCRKSTPVTIRVHTKLYQ